MKLTILTTAIFTVMSGVAIADSSAPALPAVPGNTVPVWVFGWSLTIFSFLGGILLLVIKLLWAEARKTSGLSETERNQLTILYDWHAAKDDDQVPLWYVPRSWVELIHKLRADHVEEQSLLTRIVEHNDGINADLRQQLKERLEQHDRQQVKMLKLAVRVQRAVEALAGLEPPSIEDLLDDDVVGDDGAAGV